MLCPSRPDDVQLLKFEAVLGSGPRIGGVFLALSSAQLEVGLYLIQFLWRMAGQTMAIRHLVCECNSITMGKG